MTITADRILAGIKRRSTIVENNNLLDDDDLLALCDDVIKAYIVPLLISVRGEYFVVSVDEPAVEDQSEYNFPARAVGLTLREIKLRRSDNPGDVVNLVDIPLEHADQYRNATGEPEGYYFRNDQIIIVPAPTSDDWVFELWHEQHPSNLVKLEEAAKVVSVADNVVTVEDVPEEIAVDAVVDFVRGRPGHRIMAMDKTITNVSGVDITFAASAVPSGLAAGDYISLTGTTPVLQIPDLLHPVLETIVSRRATYSLGDFEGRKELSDDEKVELKNALIVVEPRNRGEARKIVNRGGLLRGRAGGKRRGYYR